MRETPKDISLLFMAVSQLSEKKTLFTRAFPKHAFYRVYVLSRDYSPSTDSSITHYQEACFTESAASHLVKVCSLMMKNILKLTIYAKICNIKKRPTFNVKS